MKRSIFAGLTCLATSVFSLPITSFAEQTSTIRADEVVVTASRIAQSRESVLSDVSVITSEEIERAGQSSLIELLQAQPGVEISSTGGFGKSASIRLRGANDNHTVVLVDGLRINSATTGATAIQHLPLNQIERIEILRGSASHLYGSEAIGGVVQIFTKRHDGTPRFNFSAGIGGYDTQQTSAGVAGTLNDTNFSIQAGYLHSGGFSSRKAGFTGFNPDNDGYHNRNLSAHISQQLNDAHEIGASYFRVEGVNHFDSTSNTSAAFNAYGEQSLNTWDVYWRAQPHSFWQSNLRVGRGVDDLTDHQRPSGTNPSGISIFRTKQNQFSWQNDFTLPVGVLTAGLERLQQKVEGTTALPVRTRDVDSAFIGWQGQLGAHALQANLRSDDNSQFGRHNTGLLAYGYQFLPHWRATANYSSAFNAPTFNQLYFPSIASFKSNPNLRPEESRNREIGLRYANVTQHAEITLYRNKVENLIALDGTSTNVNISRAELDGVTLAWAGKLAEFNLRANLDLQNPEDATTGKLLPRRAQRHGMLGLSRALGDWILSGEVIGSSSRYDVTTSKSRMEGYALVNLTADYQLNSAWSFNARVNNLLNKNYQLASGFETPGMNLFLGLRWQPGSTD